MLVFLTNRILQTFMVLLAMSLLVFASVYAIGNPIDVLINPDASEAEKIKTIKGLGLDKSLLEQYFIFLKNAFKGELGYSFVHNRPAISLILERLPATLELTIFALLIAIIIGIPLGVIAGLNPNNFISRFILSISIFFFSLPTFWVGLIMIMIFSVSLNIFPSTGRGDVVDFLGYKLSFLTLDGLKHLILPSINLALYPLALVIRMTFAGIQETLPLDFIKFAKSKGLSNFRIITFHLLKYILVPIITVIGLQFSVLMAFAVITESIFAWPGMGRLIIESITLLDRPVIVAYLLVIVFIFMLVNLIVDILYSLLDPRIRISENK